MKKNDFEFITFQDDINFLKKYIDVVIMSSKSGDALVAISPQLQGRVLTSSAAGMNGLSYGWINRELISSNKILEHINAFGGEDRFWIGPEGGQFSIFFKKDVEFNLNNWFTPAAIDTESFEVVWHKDDRIMLSKRMLLKNYSGTEFDLQVDREIQLLSENDAVTALGITQGNNIKMAAYQSVNKMTNSGSKIWKKETGLLSIWVLGMFNPSPSTTVVIPFNEGSEDDLGQVVNDAYFGKVPSDRLVIKNNVIYFSGDGQYRSKIGLSPKRAKSVLGSYDEKNSTLTIVQYNKPDDISDYVNSMWELQDKPYAGDVVNSYNDGPPEPNVKPLGPFYELETSSPAAALAPGDAIEHIHQTFHLQGSEAELDIVAKAMLGVSIQEIKSAFWH